MCWTASRWFGLSRKPPVPGVLAWTKLSGETHSALAAVVVISVSETCRACMRTGSAWTCSCRSRWP